MNKVIIAKAGLVLLILIGIPGLNLSFNPRGISAIFDVTMNDIDSNIGLRADAGGAMNGITILLILAFIRTQSSWLHAAIIILGCIFVVRVFGVINYGLTQTQIIILALEVVMIAIMWFAANAFREKSAQ